jgi:dTDP-4-dehydrorhamnose reductase
VSTVLVTGASGMLGANAVHLLAPEHEVVAVSGTSAGSVAGRRLIAADLAAPGVADALLAEHRPDLVLHCAALTDVDRCEADPALADRVNAELPGLVAAACRRRRARLIHVSTDAVYGGPGPHREDAIPAPVNLYAASKVRGEDRVREQLPGALVLRTTLHGWRPGPRTSFSEAILRTLVAGERPQLFADVRFSPLVAGDIVEQAMRLHALQVVGTFNLGSSDAVDKAEFGRILARGFGFDPDAIQPIALAERRLTAARPLDPTMDVTRLTAVAGPPPTVAEGVARLRRELEDGTAAALRGGSGRTLVELLGREAA